MFVYLSWASKSDFKCKTHEAGGSIYIMQYTVFGKQNKPKPHRMKESKL